MKTLLGFVALTLSVQAHAGKISSGGDGPMPAARLECQSIDQRLDDGRPRYVVKMAPHRDYSGTVTIQWIDFGTNPLTLLPEQRVESRLVPYKSHFALILAGEEFDLRIDLAPMETRPLDFPRAADAYFDSELTTTSGAGVQFKDERFVCFRY